jgi:Fe-S-cluster-containing hydrogenase component 2
MDVLCGLQGAEKLGFKPERIPRNVKGCVDCGHCCHGCPYGSKQSTNTALMEPLLLADRGLGGHCSGAGAFASSGNGFRLQVIPHCAVSRVLYDDVPGTVQGADGQTHPCRKRAVGVEATVRVFPDHFPEMSVKERLDYLANGERVIR